MALNEVNWLDQVRMLIAPWLRRYAKSVLVFLRSCYTTGLIHQMFI